MQTLQVEEVVKVSTSEFIDEVTKSFSKFSNANIIDKHPAIFVAGQPGIGKSQSIIQIKDNLESATGKKVYITDVRLLLFNPIDLRGIPVADKNREKAIWLRPEIFELDDSNETINIFFLDELTAAPTSLQAAAYQIALDKTLDGLALEAVGTANQRVKISLDAHPAELLPAFDRVHRRPAVCIAVDEEDRACGEVE